MQKIAEKYQLILPYIKYFNFGMFLLLAFSLPLYKHFIPVPIFLWGISWLLETNFNNRFSALKKHKFIFILSLFFYLLHVISLLYTQNQPEGKFELEVKLTIFIFPLFFIGLNELYKKHFDKVLLAFVCGNLIASLLCLLFAFYRSMSLNHGHLIFDSTFHSLTDKFTDNGNHFFYNNISLFHHTSYFSMYLIFATVICFYILFERKIYGNLLKGILGFSIFLFTIMLFFLSSRTAFLTEIIILTIIFIIYRKRFKLKFIQIGLLILIGISITLMSVNPRFLLLKSQISETSQNSGTETKESKDVSTLSRLGIWESSYIVIKNNLLFGVGPGDVINELIDQYKNKKVDYALAQKLNAHNQYLETFIGLGVCGILTLCCLLFLPFYQNVKSKKYLLSFFLLITIINFAFESMLNTQAGVIYFAFFYNFLIYAENNEAEVV